MRNFVRTFAPVVALFWLLTGCEALTGRTIGRSIDDANITTAVNAQLVRDKASNFTRIDVDTNNGIVTLNGTVVSAEQRARAEEITRKVGGVKGVINNLQIQR